MTIIYQILDNTNGNSYIGSTTKPINTRMSLHSSSYNRWINNNHFTTYYSSFEVIKNNNYEVYILETIPEGTNRYLRERYYVETVPNCINKYTPSRTMKQYYQENREQVCKSVKQYYENNKQKCISNIKERYNNNTNGYRDKQIERYQWNAIQRLILNELDE